MIRDESWEFDLPSELIAQDPPEKRGDSRLLLVEPGRGVVGERRSGDLERVLRRGDLLVLNESRVLPARLGTRRADTGGHVEILLVSPEEGERTWLAMARPARRLKPGIVLEVQSGPVHSADDPATLEIVAKRDDGMVLVRGEREPAALAEECGSMPLPPYIRREGADAVDSERAWRDRKRYQTVFAQQDPTGAGSVAAPTAGLHFSESTLAVLRIHGVQIAKLKLHVGPGTFQPPSQKQLTTGRLHREFFELPAETWREIGETRAAGGRVIAVGTTSLRVLETAARLGLGPGGEDLRFFTDSYDDPEPVFAGSAERREGGWWVAGQTRLFIRPPERITAADGLLTNFHLPGSSLLMLVAALMGPDTWRPVYEHAVKNRLRFYSYGDCMLILPGRAGKEGT